MSEVRSDSIPLFRIVMKLVRTTSDLPENINVSLEQNGQKYKKHLFVDEKCEATFNLNGWERAVLKEEMEREDFVCWLRNPPRKALGIMHSL